jgi:glycosyltransferase involved in cell wall biosynthesis
MRILFVATYSNPIAARWIEQLADTGWDIHVYGTMDGAIHPYFRNVTLYTKGTVSGVPPQVRHVAFRPAWPLKRGRGRLRQLLPRVADVLDPEPTHYIANLLRKLKPDCIHSLKTPREGLNVLEVKRMLGAQFKLPWIHSIWGDDIKKMLGDQYQTLITHPESSDNIQIRKLVNDIIGVFSSCDYILAGNPKDIAIAFDGGFKGELLGEIPSGGGWPIDQMRRSVEYRSPSKRNIIAIKGYQVNGYKASTGGQVLTALDAISLCRESLSGYKIIIHSAIGTYASGRFQEVKEKAEEVSHICNVSVEFLPYSPPDKIWELFGNARLAIGISSADGTPNTTLEAMIMGAYPIQSDTGGLEQWIDSGRNGALVSYNDPLTIARAIEMALRDDQLVDTAAEINMKKTSERIDRPVIQSRVISMYERIGRLHV